MKLIYLGGGAIRQFKFVVSHFFISHFNENGEINYILEKEEKKFAFALSWDRVDNFRK